MHAVAFLLAAAAVALLLARLLSVPAIPLLLLAGVLLEAAAPIPAASLEDALVLGATFLLFLAGMELDPRRMRAQSSAAARVGSVHFVVLTGASFGLALWLGFYYVSGTVSLFAQMVTRVVDSRATAIADSETPNAG